ncbi:MAG: 6-hydroxymethylpterin diphosphokinase MptE-like protein [Syntrophomonas sp.]
MALQDNMEILKNSFPDLWKSIAEIEDKLDRKLVRVVNSKNAITNLKVRKQFIHSKENPQEEARDLIGQYKNMEEHSDILFYGLGLGYQIKTFIEQYPNTPFSIYEPVPEVLYQFLCHADLKELPLNMLRNIYLESKPEDMDIYSSAIVKQIRSSILIIELPSYQSIFAEKRQSFFNNFAGLIEEHRHSVATYLAFEKRWTINSLNNFIRVLNTPDIILEKKGCFRNKPALLVASGPSLQEEIETLRIIKERGLAYIFSVGTAVNTLIQNDIYPDAACTYDPTKENQIVFQSFQRNDIKTIPLVFGSTVGYETLISPGPQMHMLISQDTLAAFYLKAKSGNEPEFISDAATIAVITLQLLNKLGFNPIILVGLNLAYRDGINYAPNSTFFPLEASREELDNAMMVRDVNGSQVACSYSFNGMRRQIEVYLEQNQNLEVINTTQYGADIAGSRFQSLSEVIGNLLADPVVEENWLDCPKTSYDLDHLIKQHHKMSEAFASLNRLFEQCRFNLDGIGQTAESQDAKLIGQSYELFNRSMAELRENIFFAIVVEPMNRVEMQFLMLAVPDISRELDPIKKSRMMEKEFQPLLQSCEKDFQETTPVFQEIDQFVLACYKLHKIRIKFAGIKILLVDGDGVLTDGSIYLSPSGNETRKFHYQDRIAVSCLGDKGIKCLLINEYGDQALEKAARSLGFSIYTGNKEKAVTMLSEQYRPEEIACIWSTGKPALLKRLGLSFSVKNASRDLKNEVDYVLKAGGGEGAIMELLYLLESDRLLV